MKPLLHQTLVLIEDRRFYRHWGIDPLAMLRAFLVNLREKRYAQGASTITQQLARTLYLHRRKTLSRKFFEILISFWLELRYSKKDILRSYGMNVYLGQRSDGTEIRGFRAASRYHFNKHPDDLTPAEIATLVGSLRGPNRFLPKTPQGQARALTVLVAMFEQDLISRGVFMEASREI